MNDASHSAPRAPARDTLSQGAITALLGIYHAEGTPWGEVKYWVGARLGKAHCALCDITHGSVREKEAWRECRTSLPVEFATAHLDERSPEIAALSDGHTPCVIARTAAGPTILLGPDDLEACAGDPACLADAIHAAAADRSLTFAEPTA